MKIVRRRDGTVVIDGKVTTLKVEHDRHERDWNAYAGEHQEWLFSCRTQWHVMNAITAIAEAIKP
jgi:hypothetical protein